MSIRNKHHSVNPWLNKNDSLSHLVDCIYADVVSIVWWYFYGTSMRIVMSLLIAYCIFFI